MEGPGETVKRLAKTIYADPRHSCIIQLHERETSKREFPLWSMEFKNLSCSNMKQLAKFLERQSATLTPETKPISPILRLLAGFGMHA